MYSHLFTIHNTFQMHFNKYNQGFVSCQLHWSCPCYSQDWCGLDAKYTNIWQVCTNVSVWDMWSTFCGTGLTFLRHWQWVLYSEQHPVLLTIESLWLCRWGLAVSPGGATLIFIDTMCVHHPEFGPLLAGQISTKTPPFWRDNPLKCEEISPLLVEHHLQFAKIDPLLAGYFKVAKIGPLLADYPHKLAKIGSLLARYHPKFPQIPTK